MRRLVTMALAVLAVVAAPSFTSAQTREGIAVHGHWAVEIRNPDGSLSSRHEFENALTEQGQAMMASLLGRGASPFTWMLASNLASGLVEPWLGTIPGYASYNLAVTLDPSGRGTRLEGSFVSLGGSLLWVETRTALCGVTVGNLPPPSGLPACDLTATNQIVPFSRRTLPNPIDVQAGQIVQIQVTFTFS